MNIVKKRGLKMQEKIDWEWDKLLEKSKINNSKKILKKSEKNREKELQNISEIVEKELDEIQELVNSKIETDLKIAEIEIVEGLKLNKNLEKIESYVKLDLEKDIDYKINQVERESQHFLDEHFDNLYNEILEMIEENQGNRNIKISYLNSEIRKKVKKLKSKENEIKKLEKEMLRKLLIYSNEEARKKWAKERNEKDKIRKKETKKKKKKR